MTDNFVIFAIVELLIFCAVLYLIIRANIYVNTLQKEVNEMYFYMPTAIRDIKDDLKEFNKYIKVKMTSTALSQQEVGFLLGRIFADIFLSRFTLMPFKKNMVLASTFFKLWKLRDRLKATFVKLCLG